MLAAWTFDQARIRAQLRSQGDQRRIFWYVNDSAPKNARTQNDMEPYRIDTVARQLLQSQGEPTQMCPFLPADPFDSHPWNRATHAAGDRAPRWNAGKDLSFARLRPERMAEVRCYRTKGHPFRHTTQFNRWPDSTAIHAHAPTPSSNSRSPSPRRIARGLGVGNV